MEDPYPEYAELIDLLRDGAAEDWEFAAQVVDGFPSGSDGFVGRRWILNAIDCGSLSSVRWMLARGVELSFWDAEGRSVWEACLHRNNADKYELLADLIAAGANPDDRCMNDWTALHLAAVRNDLLAVEMLLAAGADRQARTRIDNYATAEEEAEQTGNREAARMIREYKPR